MPAIRSTVHDPLHRVTLAFEPGAGGELWVYSELHDRGHLPEHFHPSLTERWEATDGEVEVKLDGVWRSLRPDAGPLLISPGQRHELRNASGATVSLRTEVRPAGHLQEFLVEASLAAQSGLFDERGRPRGLRGAAWISEFALRHAGETMMTSPPPGIQRVVLPVLARALAPWRPELPGARRSS